MEEQKNENSEIKLDLKSKIFFLVIAILIIGAVAATYYRYIVKRDYLVQAQIDCDPETENCFVWQCDPQSSVEGEACTGDEEMDIWYYKILSRNAKNIPDCDPNDENCGAYICEEGEADCTIEYCSAENVPEGEECNDPEQYILDNPPEEEGEGEECDEGDEECLAGLESLECDEGDEECLAEEEGAVCDDESGECAESESEEEAPEECSPDDPACASQTLENEQEDSVPVLPQAETELENNIP